MQKANCITGPFTAIVEGKPTGLAGCADTEKCKRAANCMRADPALKMRYTHACQTTGQFFIPAGVKK